MINSDAQTFRGVAAMTGRWRVCRRPSAADGPMTTLRQSVDVLIEHVPLASRWASERWQPAAVRVATAQTPGSGPVREAGDDAHARWRFNGFEVELHPSEGEGYYLNTTSPEPRVFVMWRPAEEGSMPPMRPAAVTVSYNEAARLMDGGEQVDTVPMPDELAQWVRDFVAAYYTPAPRRK